MARNDHSFYEIQILEGNLEPARKYFRALINGFGGCGGFNFSKIRETDPEEYYWVPSDIEDISFMEEKLKEYIGDLNQNFGVRINYFGKIASREHKQMLNFTDEIANQLLNTDPELHLSENARIIRRQIRDYNPTHYIVEDPIKLATSLQNLKEMATVLAIIKMNFKVCITKYLPLREHSGEDEIRFFTSIKEGNKSAITMFILYQDRLQCCSVDNIGKYILDIDDGFFTIFKEKITTGEYAKSFEEWKASEYNYKLQIIGQPV